MRQSKLLIHTLREAPKLPFPYAHEPELDLKPSHFHTPGIIAMEDQARAFADDEHQGLPLDHAGKFYFLRALSYSLDDTRSPPSRGSEGRRRIGARARGLEIRGTL
jgi:hypothetical protein